jgi:hypothetical protein
MPDAAAGAAGRPQRDAPRWGNSLHAADAAALGSRDAVLRLDRCRHLNARRRPGRPPLLSHLIALTRQELGSLDRVSQVMQLNILVRCSPGFKNVSRVADGASEAFFQVFGPNGRHRRTVLPTTELPESAPVQVSRSSASTRRGAPGRIHPAVGRTESS